MSDANASDSTVETNEIQEIQDEGGTRKYFSIMEHMADDELDPYQYRLLGHYKRVCGVNGGACIEDTRTTATATRMSMGKVSSSRRELEALGYIRIEDRGTTSLRITLIDIMPENVMRYASRLTVKAVPGERSSGEQDPQQRSSGEQGTSNGVHQMNGRITKKTKANNLENPPLTPPRKKRASRKVESDDSYEPEETPLRSQIFDLVARMSFHIADTAVLRKAEWMKTHRNMKANPAKVIGILAAWIIEDHPNVTTESLSEFYSWYADQIGAHAPRSPEVFAPHWYAWKQQAIIADHHSDEAGHITNTRVTRRAVIDDAERKRRLEQLQSIRANRNF